MRTQTHKEQRKKMLVSNHEKIREIMRLTDFEYKEQIFEYGCCFLECYYGANSNQILRYSRCRNFWRWWLSEFYRWEFEFLSYYYEHRPAILSDTWTDEMIALIGDQLTTAGFRNYLKLFHNVRI